MKNRKFKNLHNAFLLLMTTTTIISCSSLPTITDQTQSPIDTNPFEETVEDEEQSQVDESVNLGGYGMGPIGFDPLQNPTFIYTGAPINLSFFYEGTGSDTEVGLMFFLDGIAQPYQIIETSHPDETSVTNQDVYLSKFQLSSDIRIEFTVSITPVTGSVGDEFGLFPVTLFEPSFMPVSEKGNFGIYHNASFYLPIAIHMETDTLQQSEDFIVNTDLAPIPDYKKENASLDASGRINQPVFTFYAGDFLSWREPQLLTENRKIDMHLSGFGGIEATYRVTVFVNHQPVPIEGHENFLIETHYDQVSTFTFTLDLSGYDRMNSLYAIIVPVGESYKNQDIYGQKTGSILLINDLAEPLSADGE